MYKVGDRVRLKNGMERNKVYGKLTLWGEDMYDTYLSLLGKELTITMLSSQGNYQVKNGRCYLWSPEMLEPVVEHKNPATVVTIEVFNNTTVAKLREGDKVIRTGVARCNPSDTFDAYEGARLALDRLYGKVEPYKRKKEQTPSVRIVKQDKYGVGDKVLIVDKWGPECLQNSDGKMDKWLGKIMTIRSVLSSGLYKMEEDQDARGILGGWVWYYAAVAGKVVEDKPKAREVKRPAKVGEWIKITRPSTAEFMNAHDPVRVIEELEKGVKFFVSNHTCRVLHESYVVLEGYDPDKGGR